MSQQISKRCVPPCSRPMSELDAHDYCFVCLGEEHAVLAIEKGGCEHCDQLTVKMLRSRLNYFQSAPALPSWGSRMDLNDEQETGPSFSLVASSDPNISSREHEARSGASSVHEGDDISLGSSEHEQPASEHSSLGKKSVEELLEVVTRAVARLQLDWPREQETPKHSKLEDRFLSGGRGEKQQHQFLPFFEDLHDELSKSWSKPYTSRIFVPSTSTFSTIVGAKSRGYTEMPRVEETLASYLSPESASSIKKPTLPTKPCRVTSSLVGKAYQAAGQAGAALHTMAVLQAYQADLLKDLSAGSTIDEEAFSELRRATDLSLRATKQTARAIGRSMSALVSTERHLWLNLTGIKEKDRVFLLDSLFLPLVCLVTRGGAVCHPAPPGPSKAREVKKQSVAERAPLVETGDRLAALSNLPSQTSGLLLTESGSPDGLAPDLVGVVPAGWGAFKISSPFPIPSQNLSIPATSRASGGSGFQRSVRCTVVSDGRSGRGTSNIPSKGSIKINTTLGESGSVETSARHLCVGIKHSTERIQNPIFPSSSAFQRRGFHFRETGADARTVTRATNSSEQRGHRTCSSSRERVGLLQQILPGSQKGWGLRPILDLRGLNHSVKALKFKMLTVKTVVTQIQHHDWFVTIDLKDAYFHIEILPQHRKFLRFAFGAKRTNFGFFHSA
ncbi:Gag-Pol polyprotein [Labeo rohita]|uniref:Gag-Pol polyprotein n=1 Tax=Labeo rohita TaxID=84645 RepID=A0ABQ8MVY9_LABRO|nr:Gag-Pol polyprotein [Labeo rohita]